MTILLVDDHALVRAGLRRLLAGAADGAFLEAATGVEGLELMRREPLDLVILDLNLPGLGGAELVRRMSAMRVAPILVLTIHAEPLYAKRALDAGAAGYVTKDISPDELLEAVRRLLAGGRYVEAGLAQALAVGEGGAGDTVDRLSPRDLEILRLLASGASLTQIAAALSISYKTVANIASQIKSKLGVSRTADLVRLALETGLAGAGATTRGPSAGGHETGP